MALIIHVVGYSGTNAFMEEILSGVTYEKKIPTNKPLSRALRYFTKLKMQKEDKRISDYPRMYYLVAEEGFEQELADGKDKLIRTLQGRPVVEVLGKFDYDLVSGIDADIRKNPYTNALGYMEGCKAKVMALVSDLEQALDDDIREYKAKNDPSIPKEERKKERKVWYNPNRTYWINFDNAASAIGDMEHEIDDAISRDIHSDTYKKNAIIELMLSSGKLDPLYLPANK